MAKSPPPRRLPNRCRRVREYLTTPEVERLIDAARSLGRNGHRDATLLLVMYRHAFRVGEAVMLKWEAVDFGSATLHVWRKKGTKPSARYSTPRWGYSSPQNSKQNGRYGPAELRNEELCTPEPAEPKF